MFRKNGAPPFFMIKNIFEKSEKFFMNTGTFLNFDPVLYMDGDKAVIIFLNVIEREKQQYFYKK